MPLFDFECLVCGKVNEHLLMSREVPKCPDCGSLELKKLIGAPAPVGKSQGMIARARQRAAAAGHLSNFSRNERGSKG
ncbi:MAG: zinc ribbon domain-containing protein [Polyangiaceae bacterium]